ncbi:MAG: DNA internalization-related competence protein ComEC/Rec2, partial [Deltaproteobacteria bacterium]|nr:DNA internalization-related competence protein ComEC/Rec2 [Deltaproteobacteria bacterium]
MPRLLLLLGAQCAGIVAADLGWLAAHESLLGAVLCLAAALLAGGPRLRLGLAVLAAGCASALHLGHSLEEARAAVPAAPFEAVLEGRVVEARHASHGSRLVLRDVVGIESPVPLARGLLVRVPADGSRALRDAVRGDRVRMRARLRPLGGLRNPGRAEAGRHWQRRGVGAAARPLHALLAVRAPDRSARPLAPLLRLRLRVARRLEALGPGGPLLAALALGERGGIPDAARRAFSELGIAHLLAVSGLHLALGAGLAFGVARRGLARWAWAAARLDTRRPALALALGFAVAQALLAGFGVPVRRALLLLLAVAAEVLQRRPARRGAALAAAACVVMAFDPAALFSPGAQLSFAATAALVLAPGGLEGGWRAGLRASATALLATAPLAALSLGVAAPAALLVNALAVPLTGLVLLPAALLSAAAIGLAPGAAPSAVLAAAAERMAAWALQLAEAGARAAPDATGTVPAYGALGLAVGLAWFGLTSPRTGVRLACAALSGLVLALAPPRPLAPPPPRVVFLDVGQGDAVLVQSSGAAILVDAGGAFPGGDRGRDAVLPALAALGVERLDLLALTHADLDHRGGAPAILRGLPVARLWLPRGGRDAPGFAAVLHAARERGVPVVERGTGAAALDLDGLRVESLWPPPDAGWRGNDASLVLRVTAAGGRVLLPGDLSVDAERALVGSGADLRADLLLLPHHGSRTSSSAALLEAVGGVAAVVSAPCLGRFRMPDPRVEERVRAYGYALWWTGRDGAVLAALGERRWLHSVARPRSCRPAAQGSLPGGRFAPRNGHRSPGTGPAGRLRRGRRHARRSGVSAVAGHAGGRVRGGRDLRAGLRPGRGRWPPASDVAG